MISRCNRINVVVFTFACLMAIIPASAAQRSVLDDILSPGGLYPKEVFDFQMNRRTVPGLLIKGDALLTRDSRAVMLTEEILRSWLSYYKDLHFYDEEVVRSKEREINDLLSRNAYYFVLDLAADRTVLNNREIDLNDMNVFLMNDNGKIVDAERLFIGNDDTLIGSGIPKIIAVFPRIIPGTMQYLRNDSTQYLKLYVTIYDTIYMFKYEFFKG